MTVREHNKTNDGRFDEVPPLPRPFMAGRTSDGSAAGAEAKDALRAFVFCFFFVSFRRGGGGSFKFTAKN